MKPKQIRNRSYTGTGRRVEDDLEMFTKVLPSVFTALIVALIGFVAQQIWSMNTKFEVMNAQWAAMNERITMFEQAQKDITYDHKKFSDRFADKAETRASIDRLDGRINRIESRTN
jgi:uncharacterized protein YdiU (UPF0061 family)